MFLEVWMCIQNKLNEQLEKVEIIMGGFRIICNSENPNAQYWEIKENQCFANIQGWLPHAHKVCEVVEEKYQ
jgi:hypothetical protein